MDRELFENTLKSFDLEEPTALNKVMTAPEAIQTLIHPGDFVHFGITHGIPYGLCNELLRSFDGTDPQFTLSTMGASSNVACLIHRHLVKKLITSYAGDIYPAPGPNRIFDEAWKAGLEIEPWTVLTLTQRLIAGALGLGFFPTNSLKGSSLAEDNAQQGLFAIIPNPFDKEKPQAVIPPLQPDVALVHGWMADATGNTVLPPPWSESPWGALASKKVIVSVEHIVAPEIIRHYNHLVKIPGTVVNAVCEIPFGCHPGGLSASGLDQLPFITPYAEDYDFITQFHHIAKDDSLLDSFIEEWILNFKTPAEYLAHLGSERISQLEIKAGAKAWQDELATSQAQYTNHSEGEWNPSEIMIITAGNLISRICQEQSYLTILAGQGASNLAAWLAMYDLRDQGINIDLVAELGFIGYSPQPGSPFIFNFANIPQCKMLSDSFVTMGTLVTGPNNRCLGALGAAQIDIMGNINSNLVRTLDGNRLQYLVGSGGANDVLSSARETVVICPSKGGSMRFVQQVPFSTGTGQKVTTLITDQAVFRKVDDQLVLDQVIPPNSTEKDFEKLIKQVKKNTGWHPFITSDPVTIVEDPTLSSLMRLRLLDPQRNFLH